MDFRIESSSLRQLTAGDAMRKAGYTVCFPRFPIDNMGNFVQSSGVILSLAQRNRGNRMKYQFRKLNFWIVFGIDL